MAVFGIWLVQGLDGAPRRWSVLPSQYDTLTRISLPLVFVLAAAQALFFWNVIQTLRGKSGVATYDERGIPVPAVSSKEWSVHVVEAALVLMTLALACIFAVGGYLIGREHGKGGDTSTTPVTSTNTGAMVGDPEAGADVFASAGCGGCHVLAAAGSSGTVGPSLDATKPSTALVIQRVTKGMGAMPPFGDQLSAQQIADVAAYVHESTSK
jgi:mono/diheme cytochrome c family protein